MNEAKKTEAASVPAIFNINGINSVIKYKIDSANNYIDQGIKGRDENSGEYYFQAAREVIAYLDGMIFMARSLGYDMEKEEQQSGELFDRWNNAAH